MNEILMRAGSLILCIIIILTIIPICSIAAPEDGGRKLYIENPGLEESGGDIAPGWGEFKFSGEANDLDVPAEGYGYERSSARAYSGSASLKITDNRTNKSAGVYSSGILDIHEGYTYRASAWIYRESGDAPQLYLRFFNMYSMEIASAAVYSESTVTGSWEKVTVTGVAPAGAVMARIMPTSANASTSVFYVDDVEMYELPFLGGWTKTGGISTSAGIPVIEGTQYMISGFSASDTVTAAFYKDGELYKQVQNPAGDKYWRFYAPQGADTLYISTNGTAEKLELNTAGNGTQIPDGSFEIMAKTGTSA